ncbi:MAG: DEAD/DEAH box helicase family protein, partial [Planctomycetaceae bacterium]|nr:DEAD/DEAH box helicase family protein [Planctomycetaceae bacterium]
MERQALSPALHNCLIRLAAFQNPEFYRAQAMRLPTYDKPRIIGCAEQYEQHLALPRGCLEDVQALLSGLGIEATIDDQRFSGTPVDLEFRGSLREGQEAAIQSLLRFDTGVLSATTAFGKTVVAARMIAERGVNTLVLVHRRQLVDQWMDRLSTFLNLTESDIGCLGGGRRRLKGRVDVGVIQSFVRKDKVNDVVANYGHIVVDECHHLSARSFELVVRRAKARYVLGLSATVTRKDGHHPIIFMQCGQVCHTVEAKGEAESRPFEHRVIVRPTAFEPTVPADPDIRMQFQDLYRDLIADRQRNQMIVDDVLAAVKQGRSPVVLTERRDHLEILWEMLLPKVQHLIRLQGGQGIRQRREAQQQLDAIPADEERVLLATGKYLGEGFDDARLDTLFLTLPVSWRGIIAQYVGRLHRLHESKVEVQVFDYADLNVPLLSRMFDRRCAGYEAVGYQILVPGSAVPGWPADVQLPVEPNWRADFADSIQRLISDGIDEPLAQLFADATKPIHREPSDLEGAERARSASEAFLFRRLETLRETAGQFQMNVRLPIPFDGWGNMEVDLLHRSLPLVIELDGEQHFEDRDAWRRDRRKDALLQENGYLVLRFLAEDLGPRLSAVLDQILRSA